MNDKQLEAIKIRKAGFKNWNLETIYEPETLAAAEEMGNNLKAIWEECRENIRKGFQAVVVSMSEFPYGGHPVKGSTKPTFITKPHHRKRRR